VWSAGRRGPSRTRVTESAFTVTAEEIHTILLRDGGPLEPGWTGWVIATAEAGHSWRLGVSVTSNAVWRRGRVFLVCPRCDRWATGASDALTPTMSQPTPHMARNVRLPIGRSRIVVTHRMPRAPSVNSASMLSPLSGE
jgi:hypothetical protein